MDFTLQYDDSNPLSIETYGKKLVGHTFLEVYEWKLSNIDKPIESYLSGSRKGGLGNLLEEQYFCYEANSSPEPDFPKAGVELKATPYEKNKNGSIKAGERLVLGMISYDSPIEMDFYKSHAWEKGRLILLIYYLRNKALKNKALYSIDYVKLFTPPEVDMEIIINDYKIITEKIRAGKAHELSEGDTMYLGACTKGANAIKSTVPQYYGNHEPARKRAFCYKVSYMTYVLNNYIANDTSLVERIIDNPNELKQKSFAEVINEKIDYYVGKTDEELANLLEVEYNPKSYWITLAFRMLGIKSNRAEEFEKANIKVKAIRIEANGKMKETSPLPTFRFKEIVQEEEWEDAWVHEYLDTTKFLFVVFKKDNKTDTSYKLVGCKLWNMPYDDINIHVKKCWEKTKEVINAGVELTKKETNTKIIIENNLPAISDNPVIHVRPHTSKRFYEFEDGTTLGDGNKYTHGDELPDGRWMPKQSFFFNSSYVVSQIADIFK